MLSVCDILEALQLLSNYRSNSPVAAVAKLLNYFTFIISLLPIPAIHHSFDAVTKASNMKVDQQPYVLAAQFYVGK